MNPYFSIVIPTLNEELFLPKLLKDLTKQRNRNFEVIVVDSRSTDKTRDKVKDFTKVLDISIYEAKSNVSQGRNIGASKAKGDYLVFLDADAQINSGFIQTLTKAVTKNKGLIFIPAIIPDKNDLQMEITFRLVNYLVEFSQNLNKPFSTGGSMIVERNFFQRIGGFDEKLFLSEDHNLIQRAQTWGVRAKFLHSLKLKFSMRRMRREGAVKLFYQYLLATAHVIIKGDIKEKIFNYEMGGHLYANKVIKNNDKYYLKKTLRQIKNFFNSF